MTGYEIATLGLCWLLIIAAIDELWIRRNG